jgi:hypothetical protein
VFSFFKAKNDSEHEYRMTQLQLDIDKARAQQALDLAHTNNQAALDQADLSLLSDAIKGQSTLTGVKFIDGLSSSVRPILTYWWCIILYTLYKLTLMYSAFHNGISWADLAPIVMTEFDRSVMASIISFWFVDRAIRRK